MEGSHRRRNTFFEKKQHVVSSKLPKNYKKSIVNGCLELKGMMKLKLYITRRYSWLKVLYRNME
jgi:hypothetical protein